MPCAALTRTHDDLQRPITPVYSPQTLEEIKRVQLQKYYKAPEDERRNIECNPYNVFHQALSNCQPIIGLTSVVKSGKSYQVPTPLTDNRRRFLAMKWMITECRENKHRRTLMYEKLSQALLEAFHGEGQVIKKKHELHKMAESNRAFAHFRWW
uniref:Mitochondrial ribosomal protein S7 n=1 Tax=Leptobrachium leishanense TaxID=445787 RepID=A0A8C5QJ75_9ANUR